MKMMVIINSVLILALLFVIIYIVASTKIEDQKRSEQIRKTEEKYEAEIKKNEKLRKEAADKAAANRDNAIKQLMQNAADKGKKRNS